MNARFLLRNQKGVYTSKLFPLYNLSPITKCFDCKLGLQFNNSVLVVEKNNYTTKILNACIVYDIDDRPINTLNNFILKIACLV